MKTRRSPLRFLLLPLLVAAAWGASRLWDVSQPLQGAERPVLNPTVVVQLGSGRPLQRIALGLAGDFTVTAADDGRELLSATQFEGDLALDERGIVMGLWVLEVPAVQIQTVGDAALRVGDNWYRGRLLVSRREAKQQEPEALELRLDLPLEDYVLGVVCGEMATSAPGAAAALRAQAVAARTYALWRLSASGREFLRDDASDQRFHGVDYETASAREAVAATRGVVLEWDGRLLPAYYHADCGGATEDAQVMRFTRFAVEPLRGSSDPGCARAAGWTRTVSAAELDLYAREAELGGWIQRVEAESVTASGRWLKARVTGELAARLEDAGHLVSRFGTPSALWRAVQGLPDGSLLIAGAGRGHGVGLCQDGALRHSREGMSFEEILAHYYPGARLRPLTDLGPVLP